MKKITFVLLLVSILGGLTNLSAQGKRIPDAPFQENLWYGLGVGLGFSSFNGSSQFGFGLSPMVGYKFLGPLSIGPRASVFYTSTKVSGFKLPCIFLIQSWVYFCVVMYIVAFSFRVNSPMSGFKYPVISMEIGLKNKLIRAEINTSVPDTTLEEVETGLLRSASFTTLQLQMT